MRIVDCASLLCTLGFVWCLSAYRSWAQEVRPADGYRVVGEWRFDRAAGLLGWTPNADLSNVTATPDGLRMTVVGQDPILTAPPLGEILLSDRQVIELRIRGDQPGLGQIFYTNKTTGQYGGFEPNWNVNYHVAGDGQWQTLRLRPNWGALQKLVRLRLDLPTAGTFEVAYLSILEPNFAPITKPEWDFADGQLGGWEAQEFAEPLAISQKAILVKPSQHGAVAIIANPHLDIDAEKCPYLAVTLTVGPASLTETSPDYGRELLVYWKTSVSPTVRVAAVRGAPTPSRTGSVSTLNFHLGSGPEYRGKLTYLGLGTQRAVYVEHIRLGREPAGPAALCVEYFDVQRGYPRLGAEVALLLRVCNRGGAPSPETNLEIVQSDGTRRTKQAGWLTLSELDPGERADLPIKIQAPASLSDGLERSERLPVVVRARNETFFAITGVPLQRALALPRADYVPPPQPVASAFDIGCYYFPRWHQLKQWECLYDYPERRPLLGWYQEADPEVTDWQIKWAVEHGIKFFIVDWYWVKGKRQLEHWLLDGYFNARYRDRLKFCLLWANHNPPGTHSFEDFMALTDYWIATYFKRPEYYQIDGKPAVWIFTPRAMRQDLGGSEAVRRTLDAARERAKAAGLNGIYFVSCHADAPSVADGYDATSAYNWPAHGAQATRWPFSDMVTAHQPAWEQAAKLGVPHIPCLTDGWDSRPWHGPGARVRTGRTSQEFGRGLRLMREFMEQHGQRIGIIEAWNEYGEGSYIEPHVEYGFEFVDQIRQVFCEPGNWPTNLVPEDVGLGPYEIVPGKEKYPG